MIERDWYELGDWNLVDGRRTACGEPCTGVFEGPPGELGRAATARPSGCGLREPVAAGSFYPRDPETLAATADALLGTTHLG